jgi:peroxiredoxin
MGVSRCVLAALLGVTNAISVGDMVPHISLDLGFPPEKIDLADRVAGKKVILLGLPGAFTPT